MCRKYAGSINLVFRQCSSSSLRAPEQYSGGIQAALRQNIDSIHTGVRQYATNIDVVLGPY